MSPRTPIITCPIGVLEPDGVRRCGIRLIADDNGRPRIHDPERVAVLIQKRLSARALADIRRSPIDDVAIVHAGFRSATGDGLVQLLGPKWRAGLLPDHEALVIPYPNLPDGAVFFRARLLPEIVLETGERMKYWQPADSAPRLYVPNAHARRSFANPAIIKIIVEGEKKTLALALALRDHPKYAVVGIGGVWNWACQGKLIADLGAIDWSAGTGWLAPDSNTWTRDDLRLPVYALGRELTDRGATVSVIKIPAGDDSDRSVGADDYLIDHSVDEFLSLVQLGLNHATFGATLKQWRRWRQAKDAKTTEAPTAEAADANALLDQMTDQVLLRPAQDVIDGTLWYGVWTPGGAVFVTSGQMAFSQAQLPKTIKLAIGPLVLSALPTRFSRAGIDAYLREGGRAVIRGLFDQLAAFFRRFMAFADARLPGLLAAWVLGTYLYRAFSTYAYLQLRSPERRCGKSRLLQLLRLVAFNAETQVKPTAAQIARFADATGGVQLLDELEPAKGRGQDDDRAEVFTILNAGYERGTPYIRLEGSDGEFTARRFDIYVPRAFASIARLSETLEDRSIPLMMIRKRKDERIGRLSLRRVEPEAQSLRDRCYRWALSHIDAVLDAYESIAPDRVAALGLDDRAADIWEPLIAVASVVDTEEGGDRAASLSALAHELAGARDAAAENSRTLELLDALENIRSAMASNPQAEAGVRAGYFQPTNLLHLLQADSRYVWLKSTKALATVLQPLGLVANQTWMAEIRGSRRRYRLDKAVLADLRARFGPPSSDDQEKAEGEGEGTDETARAPSTEEENGDVDVEGGDEADVPQPATPAQGNGNQGTGEGRPSAPRRAASVENPSVEASVDGTNPALEKDFRRVLATSTDQWPKQGRTVDNKFPPRPPARSPASGPAVPSAKPVEGGPVSENPLSAAPPLVPPGQTVDVSRRRAGRGDSALDGSKIASVEKPADPSRSGGGPEPVSGPAKRGRGTRRPLDVVDPAYARARSVIAQAGVSWYVEPPPDVQGCIESQRRDGCLVSCFQQETDLKAESPCRPCGFLLPCLQGRLDQVPGAAPWPGAARG